MRNSAVIILIFIFSLTVFSQKPKPAKKSPSTPAKLVKTTPPAEVNPGNEKEEFEKAAALTDNAERIIALQKFVENFPKSAEKNRALELIVGARAAIADEQLRLSETADGIALFKLAVTEAPTPVSDKFFSEILLQIPNNVFWRGERTAAVEIARIIEEKSGVSTKQLLGLAGFYLGTENALEAQRLANKALAVDANLPNAHQTLGLAYRMNFQLEESAAAYVKALELDPNSVVSKRSLAEMKRAVGKPEEAIALYREILANGADDQLAQTGLALALFDSEKKSEAEAEMSKILETNPNNFQLLVGAAYWYAAHNDGAKAVELAQKAVAVEPRYIWAHIALARGLLQQKQPLEAEKTLLIARQYGNFPTLDYEIASMRLQAGFFREAAEEIARNFRIDGENIKTKLGGRVPKEAKTFIELLAAERRAGIFQPLAADDVESSNKLRSLLEFNLKLNDPKADETALAESAENFVKGEDKMKLHRQLFAADQLLKKNHAIGKAYELAQNAIGNSDTALEVANPSAAVLADELYESRVASIARNQLLLVPAIPRQTLSAILRGRIEELAGWSLYRQNKPAEAVIRLKRAISVLPDRSAWWRSSMWRLGTALEADGKEKDALDSYIKSYPQDNPDGGKYVVIELLYKKLNGSTDGLEAKIGQKPASVFAETVSQNAEKQPEQPSATPGQTPETQTEKSTETSEKVSPTPETTPEVKPETLPTPITAETPQPTPTETPKTETNSEKIAEKTTEAKTELTPQVQPVAETTPQPTPEVSPLPEPPPNVAETPQTSPENTTEKTVESPVQASPQPTPENSSEPKTETVEQSEPTKNSENSDTAPKTSAAPKTLFEPIIISVPRMETIKSPSKEPKEVETSGKTEEKPAEKPVDENLGSGVNRPRVIVDDKFAPKTIQPCPIVVSQETVSLLNGGGSVGVLVGFEKDGKLSDLEASTENPNDIDVSFEPEIGAQSGRAFFVIKSISTKTGEFKVFFEAPCGKKEIIVRVR
ncbi:MAG: tetratricopeptide repeat protein [Pyrinomonadaceae bacterium]|nr:tetratricopeptide repeat protein [Pyrinomonadaceae bacterium]